MRQILKLGQEPYEKLALAGAVEPQVEPNASFDRAAAVILRLAIAGIFLTLARPAVAATVTVSISAEKDAGLGGGSFASTNYGGLVGGVAAQKNFGVGNSKNLYGGATAVPMRGAIRFDLSTIPAGATIDSATIGLYFNQGTATSGTMYFDPFSASWTESAITWNSAPGVNLAYRTSATLPGSGSPRSFDLTALTRAWWTGAIANNGLLVSVPALEGTAEQYILFRQRETDALNTYAPVLTVTYTTAVTPTYTLSGRVKYRRFPYSGLQGISVSVDQGPAAATTGPDGTYTLANVPAGSRTVTAQDPDGDHYATATAPSQAKSVTLNSNSTLDFTDFAVKATAVSSIQVDKTSVAPGETFNVTVTVSNTNYAMASVRSFVDLSFSGSKVTVGAPAGAGWTTAPQVYAPGSTLYGIDAAGNDIMVTSTDYLITAERSGSFANAGAYSFVVPVTVKAGATAGPITLKYRGTIGDSRDPASTGSGTLDQQGFNVKTLDVPVAPKYNISGRVKYRRFPYAGVPGVSVSVDQGPSPVTTAWDGSYTLVGVPSGSRTVTAQDLAGDHFATATAAFEAKPVTLSGNTSLDFTDFTVKGTAVSSIQVDKSSVGPGETFNVTVTVSNSNYALASVRSFLDLSFSGAQVTVGTPSGLGWTSGPQVYSPGMTVSGIDASGNVVSVTLTDYLVTAERDAGFPNAGSYSFVVPVTVKESATAGTITLKYRGTIGDSRDPVSTGTGTRDEQGFNVKTTNVTIAAVGPLPCNLELWSGGPNDPHALLPATVYIGEPFTFTIAASNCGDATSLLGSLNVSMPDFAAARAALRVETYGVGAGIEQFSQVQECEVGSSACSPGGMSPTPNLHLSAQGISTSWTKNQPKMLTLTVTPYQPGLFGIHYRQELKAGETFLRLPSTGQLDQAGVPASSKGITVVARYGTTVITHGYNGFDCDWFGAFCDQGQSVDDPPNWMLQMAQNVANRAGKAKVLAYYKSTGAFLPCGNPDVSWCPGSLPSQEGGEVILLFDWATESFTSSEGAAPGDGSGESEAAASALFAALMKGQGPNTFGLSRLHLIGHSRGTVVMSELAERLLRIGVPVDRMTMLDPHDSGKAGLFKDYGVNSDATLSDQGVVAWEGIGEVENFFQEKDALLKGRSVAGSRALVLTDLSLMTHGRVHDWYTWTIASDQVPARDGDGVLFSAPADWFSQDTQPPCGFPLFPREFDGFAYSRLGGRPPSMRECDPVGARPSPKIDFSSPHEGLVNGDFERGVAGWSANGGGGDGYVAWDGEATGLQLGVIPLGADTTKRIHDRTYIPAAATGIRFDLKVVGSGLTATSSDTLEVRIGDQPPIWSRLAFPASSSSPVTVPITAYAGTVQTIEFAMARSGTNASSTVRIDNVHFVFGPVITAHPVSQTIASGSIATLNVVATGSPTPTYQWYHGASPSTTSPISGATGASYTTPPLTAAAYYWVRASNTAGTDDSDTATISIGSSPSITTHPASTTIASGTATTLSVVAAGTAPLTYQWYQGTSPSTTTPVSGATSSSYTTPNLTTATNYWVQVSGYGTPANSNTATVSIGTAPSITTHPAGITIASGTSTTLSVVATGTAPLTYQWYQGTSPSTANPIGGAVNSAYTTPALNTTTSYWVRVLGYGTADSNTATVTIGTAPSITTHPAGITIASGTSTTLSVVATGTAPLTYQWYQGTSPSTANPIGGAVNSAYTTPTLSTTTSYWVRVLGYGTADSNTAIVTIGTAPSITTHPAGITIASGTSTTLSVVAMGTAPLTYQWYQGASPSTANPIGGAVNSTYTTPTLSTTTSYWVRVLGYGTADSNTATVTIGTAPSITTQPAGVTIASGTSTTLSVVATGTAPLTYQWYQGTSPSTANPIGGAVNSAYATPALSTTTSYWVRVLGYGTADSNTATVTIATLPAVGGPTSTSISATTATLGGTVTADGGSAITERGVVYSETAANGNPLIGGLGVTKAPVIGATGLFATGVTGLSPTTSHSFKAFATNAIGTGYTSVATFTTTCPTITLGSLPNGNVNAAYTGSATAAGGTGPYTYAVTSGFLPGGLSLTGAGIGAGNVIGTPAATGTFPFAITATDTPGAGACTGLQSYSVVIGPEPGQNFFTVSPCRVLDTRNAAGPLGGPALVALADRIFPASGTCGIPADARAISVNIAVTGSTNPGNIRLHPGGTAVPLVSAINFKAGQTRSNNAVIPLSALGEFAAYLDQAAGTAHLILDVNGYFK